MPRPKTVFVCQECGTETPRWMGRCPECSGWNTFVESAPGKPESTAHPASVPQELSRLPANSVERLRLPMNELNTVLGGGIVPGSLVLVGGDPGIGKSTLLLQVADTAARQAGSVLYVSGEESAHQIKIRAERLGLAGEGLYLLAETDLACIAEQGAALQPRLVIIDSIQTVHSADVQSAPGSTGQVRECTMRLMNWAKSTNTPVFIVGHVTKDGAIAGPHTLEHIVDVVLYLEGEHFSSYRLLRGVKNRFGSTNEVGVFEMRDRGMVEVANPSKVFLSQRDEGAIGSVVVPTLEGTRTMLVEIQALTTPTMFGQPRRNANGLDFNRMIMVAAVLSKRAGLGLGSQDVITSVAGGISVKEPAADLGIAMAIASSVRDCAVKPRTVVLGEVGLNGELRHVSQLDKRLGEAARLGFKTCVIPRVADGQSLPSGIEVLQAPTVGQALRLGLEKRKGRSGERPPIVAEA